MADDFRQNPARERAVTDSILRPPVQAPFDLLDEGIRAIPALMEQRRQEGVEEELQYNLLGARLTAEQASQLREYHTERLNNMLEQYALIDWTDPENAAFRPQMDEAIRMAENAVQQLSQPYTAESIQTGATAQRVADAGALEPGIAQAQALMGPAVTRSERAEADRVAARDHEYAMGLEGFRQKHQVALTELQQQWQSIENQYGRDSQEAMQQKELAWQTWAANLDSTDKRWAAEYQAELQRDLQANQFDHERLMQEMQNEAAAELQRLSQIFQGDQADIDRQLQRDLLGMEITSREQIAAQDRAIRQYEVENNVRLQDAQLALAERKVEFEELNSARDTYLSLLDDYEGLPASETNEAVKRIMLSAESALGRESSQFQQLVGRVESLDSPWARMRYGTASEALEQSKLKTEADRIANELAQVNVEFRELQVTEQELLNFGLEFDNNRLLRNAAVEDAKDAVAFITTAVERGDLVSLDAMAARIAAGDMELAALFAGVDFEQWRAEAQATNEFNKSSWDWARTEREMALESHEQRMATGEVSLAESRNQAAADLAVAAPRDPDLFDAWLAGIRRNPSFEALGGESFINQLQAEVNYIDYRESLEREQQIASIYLENPSPDPEWAAGASRLLQSAYGMDAVEANMVAGLMQDEGWYAYQHRALDLGIKLNDYNATIAAAEAANDPLLAAGIDTTQMRLIIGDLFNADMEAAQQEFAGCALSDNPIGAQNQGLTCSPQEREAYKRLVNEAALRNNMLLTALVRGETIDMLALLSGNVDYVGGDVWRNQLTPEAESLFRSEYESLVPFPTLLDGESDWQLEMRRELWDLGFQDYVTARGSGASFTTYDYNSGRQVTMTAEESQALNERALNDAREGGWQSTVNDASQSMVDWMVGGINNAAFNLQVLFGTRERPEVAPAGEGSGGGGRGPTGPIPPDSTPAPPPSPASSLPPRDYDQFAERNADSFRSVVPLGNDTSVKDWVDSSVYAKSIAAGLDAYSDVTGVPVAITFSPVSTYGGGMGGLSGQSHQGIDLQFDVGGQPDGFLFPSPFNEPVTITQVAPPDYNGSWGNWVRVRTADGREYNLAHLSNDEWGSDLYAVGRTINPFEPMFRQGNTGESFGAHVDIQWINPSDSTAYSVRNGFAADEVTQGFASALGYVRSTVERGAPQALPDSAPVDPMAHLYPPRR